MFDAAENTPEFSSFASFGHDHVDPVKDLKDWKLIKGDDDDNSTGFSAIAAKHVDEKHGDMIVIALRGSDGFENADGGVDVGNTFTDWVMTNADIIVDGDNPQLKKAKEFVAEDILDNKDSHIYVVGHSLGGFNAQVISYYLNENLLGEDVYGGWFSKEKRQTVENSLSDGNYQFTRTFNAAPFFGERALDAIGIDMDTSTNPAIPLDVVFGETYNDKVFNHQMSFDVLHVIGQWLPSNKLGVEVPAFDYNVGGKIYDYENVQFQTLVDVIAAYEEERGPIEAGHRIELGREMYFLYEWINDQIDNDSDFSSRWTELTGSMDGVVPAHGLRKFYEYYNEIK